MEKKNLDMVTEAYMRYPIEHLGTKGMINATKRKLFMEGAEWRESNPGYKSLEQILLCLVRNDVITESDMIRYAKGYIKSTSQQDNESTGIENKATVYNDSGKQYEKDEISINGTDA